MGAVGGQEDLIIDVALHMAERKKVEELELAAVGGGSYDLNQPT